jgi:hypothetical protein
MAQKTFVAGDVLTASDTNLYLMHEGGAWTSWTPTWTNLTIGNATVDAKYARASRLIHWKLKMTFGSTTSVSGAIRFTLPVAAATGIEFDMTHGVLQDASASRHLGVTTYVSTTVAQLASIDTTGGIAVLINTSATSPFTWTTSDIILFRGFYESAA